MARPTRAISAASLCLLTLPLLSACSGTAAAQPKSNGCVAVTSGTAQGRKIVTYVDVTGDPAMTSAISAAAAAWNASATPVLLKPVKAGATITITASTSSTATTKCSSADKTRTSVITLDSRGWHGTGGVKLVAHPEHVVALEIGHALGLTDSGGCTALMTKKTDCSTYASGPDSSEMAKVATLYHAAG